MKSQVKIIAELPHKWQKMLLTVTHTLFYFLHANPVRAIVDRSFRYYHQGRSFLT